MKYFAMITILAGLFLTANPAGAQELMTADSRGRLIDAVTDPHTPERMVIRRYDMNGIQTSEQLLIATEELEPSRLTVNIYDTVLLTGVVEGALYTRGDTPAETTADQTIEKRRLFFYTIAENGENLLTTLPAETGRPVSITTNAWGDFQVLVRNRHALTRIILSPEGRPVKILSMDRRPDAPGRDGAEDRDDENQTAVSWTETDRVDPPDDGYEDPNG